jgi:hypothetical protein
MVKDIFKNKQGQWIDLGKLGTSKKGNVTLKLFSSTQTSLAAVFFLLFLCFKLMAEDSLPKISGIPHGDSLSKNSGMAQGDSLSKHSAMVQKDALSKNSGIETSGLTNIVLTDKKIRDGDCITVLTTNRTDRIRIKQIVDGKIEADTSDKTTYFGDVFERERPTAPVALLMAEITLNKQWDIYKVIVYTMVDKEKKKNYLSDCCELGYTDQFDRLQWVGKKKNEGLDDHITFEMEKPIFTKDLFLKVEGGKNRITEVAIFVKSNAK